MYLKSVEIHGFKSFANRIVFEFHNGITGIVGPNGSGKSNVGDAIRWVLGEQSAKQLRGAKMEDVIFAGTETRKPQGFAYVALTMDNSDHVLPVDFDEVKVSRRVYRSGESEYKINDSNVRLKDIQDLFLDTGVGKEGYSIIGQGQIEKIISGRPEDRRELFDEAAGITKFKKRKAETVKNLAAEHDNLNRVNDIIAELEKQRGPLMKQAEDAKKYLDHREKLKGYETEYFVENYDSVSETKEKAEANLTTAQNDLAEANREYDEIKAEYERLENVLSDNDKALEEENERISDLKLKRSELDNDIKLTEEKINSARSMNEHFNERITSSESKLASIDEELTKNKAERESLDMEKAGHEEKVAAKSAEADAKKNEIAGLAKKREEMIKKSADADRERAEASGKIDFYNQVIEQNKLKKTEITQKLLRNKELTDGIVRDLAECEKKLANLKAEYDKHDAALREASEKVKTLTEEREKANREFEEKQREYLRSKTMLDAMTDHAERYNGYGSTVKRIMEHASVESGIIGTVADIIHAKQEYETAIETALGGNISHIVVDKEDTAKRTITWLKQNKLGRGTFLPLDSVSVHSPGNFGGALNEEGIVGVAAGLVTFEPRFAAVVAYLLGRTLVAKDMDVATKIARKYHYSLRIVTLDGEQLSPGGSISGGAFKNNSNLLGRNREIEELTEKVKALQGEMEEAKAGFVAKADEIKKASEEANEAKDKANAIVIEARTLQNEEKSLSDRKRENEAALEEIKLDATNSEKEKSEAETALAELKASFSENVTEDGRSLDEALVALDSESKEAEAALDILNEELINLRTGAAGTDEKIAFNDRECERITNERNAVLSEIDDLKENNGNYESELAEREAAIENGKKEIAKTESELSEAEEKRTRLISEKEEITKSHSTFFTRREEVNDRKSGLDAEIVRLNSQIEKAESDLEGMVSYMQEEYNLTYSEIVKTRPEPAHGEEKLTSFALKKLITSEKNEIKELGNVNVNAVDEFRELDERYSLLTTQQSDIAAAEEKLQEIIRDLDTKMREQFTERFEKINTEFDKTFKELFGGGKGKLELVEDEDILEAGIRINAQPPGKKLQNMMQLSGGEKSLTAISLLFAIQSLSPSPFCLLDEIEAALDDSNVVRFAEYLHRLTDHTQFIVITHRRGTMNAADVLYGITMQEKGVSTMVSVNLIESELDN
ncbi:MAG: chromosome segregation protein SMC [Catonella sp.]|nr:chromosome segregation protein SMC [Catonella sp.]MDY6356127.1 chromosome segregation protein SMC [Catonella sp.]